MSNRTTAGCVLILGGGVNGACVARELAANGVDVLLVDEADLAFGATAKSTRLIHGGLRYLEYGDLALVRESLNERRRLLRLAPQFVRPLRLRIPVRRRTGGLLQAALRFLRFARLGWGPWLAARVPGSSERGLWAIRIGLWMYDLLAREEMLPRHDVERVEDSGMSVMRPERASWICSYWDAQMPSPERFVIALLKDAADAAAECGSSFEVLTYHRARLESNGVRLDPIETTVEAGEPRRLKPAMIINATGAWGDRTLADLPVEAPRLFGGTRGSHIITRHPGLRAAIGSDGIYAEAADGRLVFLLPLYDAVLVGTTDVPYEQRPDEARATEEEIAYLVGMVNAVFSGIDFSVGDVDAHYSGVRPLPFVSADRPGAIPRGHWIDSRKTRNGIPIDTLIGGKLTTCRALGEEVADHVFQVLEKRRTAGTRDRSIPGAEQYPREETARREWIRQVADETNFPRASVEVALELLGTRARSVLHSLASEAHESSLIPGTDIPTPLVDWIIASEWVSAVSDLIERRLLLAFRGHLSLETVRALHNRVVGVRGDCRDTVEEAVERLRQFYGHDISDA